MADATASLSVRKCAGCDAYFEVGLRDRNPRKWCSEACRARVARAVDPERTRYLARKRHRQKRAEYLTEHPLPNCPVCGKTISSLKAKTCGGRRCQYRYQQSVAPRCSVAACERPVLAKGLCGPHYSKAWCAENPDRKAAADGRYRALKSAAFVEDVVPAEVLERDRWTCHLCGKRIGKSYPPYHPRSASVDHVIPLSRGGEHSMQNVRAAHFGCNSAKRAGGGNEQPYLI